MTAVAPATSTLRKLSSPARVMTPTRLAGGGVILRRQAHPSRQIPPTPERVRISYFHHQQACPDRAYDRDLGQSSAQFILPMPGDQLGFDLAQFGLERGIFPPPGSKQLLGNL